MPELYPVNFRLFKLQQTRQFHDAALLQIIIREIFLPEPHRRTLHSLTEISSNSLHENVGTPPIYTKTISFEIISRLSCTIQINADITIRSKILVSRNNPCKWNTIGWKHKKIAFKIII